MEKESRMLEEMEGRRKRMESGRRTTRKTTSRELVVVEREKRVTTRNCDGKTDLRRL